MTDGARQVPEAVPERAAKPAGEIRARWAWVEAEVWTERMLTTREQGVMGGKWHSRMDKVYALPNLRQAFARVKANHGAVGVDPGTVEEFERDLEANLAKVSHSLADNRYRPQAVRRHWIRKLGSKEQRPLGIPTVRDWTGQAGLALHPVKTRMVDATPPGGFDFVGYHFEQGRKWPRRKSERKLRDTIRAQTRRTHGQSLAATLVDRNRTLVGWFEYFKHRHKTTFATLDGWVRMRLRSLLRRRRGRRGPGRGADHQRWPNALFAEHGLFSLATAHATAGQFSRG